jgi:hypothetical protein
VWRALLDIPTTCKPLDHSADTRKPIFRLKRPDNENLERATGVGFNAARSSVVDFKFATFFGKVRSEFQIRKPQ